MTGSAPPPEGLDGLAPRQPPRLARLAVSALRRRRPKVGILGARAEEQFDLLAVLDDLDTDGVFLEPASATTSVLDRRPVDLFLALHAEAVAAATGAPLPAYAPVVCALAPSDVKRWAVDPGGLLFAPVLCAVLDGSFDELRAILTDGLALRRYMQDHPDDADPIGRPLRSDGPIDVIFVDDEPVGHSVMKCVLEFLTDGTGTFRGFLDPGDAVAALSERTPDVLWTNQGMPTMNGDVLLRALRARTTHRIPTVLDSGEVGAETFRIAHSTRVGAGAFVPRPFELNLVEVAWRNAARMRRAFVHAGAT